MGRERGWREEGRREKLTCTGTHPSPQSPRRNSPSPSLHPPPAGARHPHQPRQHRPPGGLPRRRRTGQAVRPGGGRRGAARAGGGESGGGGLTLYQSRKETVARQGELQLHMRVVGGERGESVCVYVRAGQGGRKGEAEGEKEKGWGQRAREKGKRDGGAEVL